jgi:hypothetical protein
MRVLVAASGVVAVLVGCAASGPPQVPSGPWRYVKDVEDCVGFESYRGRPYDRTIILDEQFRGQLIAKLKDHVLPSPQCWYETPDRSLLLRAGDFCRSPHWVTFGRSGDGWIVTKLEDPMMSCHQRERR